jgi:hypothetical protein
MLEKEFKYFKDNYKALFTEYPNKYLVIKDQTVQHHSNTFEEALTYALTNYEIGTFLIQQCTESEDGYTQTFHSRVIFA